MLWGFPDTQVITGHFSFLIINIVSLFPLLISDITLILGKYALYRSNKCSIFMLTLLDLAKQPLSVYRCANLQLVHIFIYGCCVKREL